MEIDLQQLPVPDWGLECPTCGYALRGLRQHRCPECGNAFEVEKIVRSWHRLRAPRWTGHELPIPSAYKLNCRVCKQPLAGATSHVCPYCEQPVVIEDHLPSKQWFQADGPALFGHAFPALTARLQYEHVPHFQQEKVMFRGIVTNATELMVAREFYFELMMLMDELQQELRSNAGQTDEWTCTECDEPNPSNFEVCWNCDAPRP